MEVFFYGQGYKDYVKGFNAVNTLFITSSAKQRSAAEARCKESPYLVLTHHKWPEQMLAQA
jgi:hypothetical protein